MIVAIDPGTRASGLAILDPCTLNVRTDAEMRNEVLLEHLRGFRWDHGDRLVLEMIEHYGKDIRVGKETFETCVWIGRFMSGSGALARRLTRRAVKLHLCGSMRAKDPDVRQAILDRFGGKEKAVGKKRHPGALYGVRSHAWAALALALTYKDLGDSACYEAP